MDSGDVGWWGLAASLVLVAATIGLSLWRRLGLERDLVVATVRALVQLLAVGYALAVVLADDAPLAYAWIWVVLMVGVAVFTIDRRAPEIDQVWRVALPAMVASTTITLAVIFGLSVFEYEARTVVTLAGMMIGNAMKDTIVVSRRIVAELTEKRPEVEARLALGQPWPEAGRPYLREAVRLSMISQIETTKVVGLIALPGTMTGLILAGVDPVDAVRVQAAVMFLILGAVAVNVVVTGELMVRRMFTPDHRLRRVTTPS